MEARANARGKILAAAREGELFFTISSAAKLIGTTTTIVRYAIKMSRLDALLIGCEYRIPYVSLLDLLSEAEEIRSQWLSYLAFVRSREETRPSKPRSPLAGPQEAASSPAAAPDWYNLDRLPLPEEATADSWCRLLGFASTADWRLKGAIPWLAGESVVSREEFVDFMTAREVANLPCFLA